MAKRFFVAAFLFFSVSAFAGDGRHIVRFSGSIPDSFASAVVTAGGSLEWSYRTAGLALVTGLSDKQADALAKAAGAVEALADTGVRVRPSPSTDLADGSGGEQVGESATDPTLAMFYPLQWNLQTIGANAAWAAGRRGSTDVSVAVIDSGIDYTHVDLAGRVDLSRSVSFVPADDAIVASLFPGHHPIADLYYHGTHVASTITSNAVLAAGVTSNVTLFGVKVIDHAGSGSFANVLAGILWAADHDADVANLSVGAWLPKEHAGRLVGAVQQTVNYAHRKGTLLVVAAGNDAVDLDHDGSYMNLFCGASNVVCVSATGPLDGGIFGPWLEIDAPAYYTNFGRSAIDVAAPGGNFGGVIIGACSKTALVDGCPTDWLIAIAGTSMATPHVSGLAALLVEDSGHGKPSQIKARILQSADDLGPRGTDPYYGKGRINVPRALGLQ